MLAPIIRTDNCCYLISAPATKDFLSLDSFKRSHLIGNGNKLTYNGRAPVVKVKVGKEQGILRHYYRGGIISRLSEDKFVWSGINRTRAIVEFRLLEWMTEHQLPVPYPLGAQVVRQGLLYTCDLITREVPNTETLATRLHSKPLDNEVWNAVGKAIKKLHDHGVFHADLNANNILINSSHSVTVIDFDKCRLRRGTTWQANNIKRLKRSLHKLSNLGQVRYFTTPGWQALLDGYKN